MFYTDKCSSRKRAYENREDAEDALVYSRISSGELGARNIYRCNDCGYWHLTSRGELADVVMKRQSEIDRAREAERFAKRRR